MRFTFIEYNPRRAQRGAEAARVAVVDDEGRERWLWMSKRDIANNMREFGCCAELTKARDAYRLSITGSVPTVAAEGSTQGARPNGKDDAA